MEKIFRNKKYLVIIFLCIVILAAIVIFNVCKKPTYISIDRYAIGQKKDYIYEKITISLEDKIGEKDANKIIEKLENKGIKTEIILNDMSENKIGTISKKGNKVNVNIMKKYKSFFSRGFNLDMDMEAYKEFVVGIRKDLINEEMEDLNESMQTMNYMKDNSINDFAESFEIEDSDLNSYKEFNKDDDKFKNALELTQNCIKVYNDMIKISCDYIEKSDNEFYDKFEEKRIKLKTYLAIYQQGVNYLDGSY
ncbi:hypothetical protein NYF05_07220 [Clostridioides difficile]|uniref:hypothetical protein n=1 Tax=Clostridioides difficile TaxID=1496 RepID=UPI0021C7E95F|nr:hypothetical protein [Clostridioides difficile]UWD42756.1 hypothetical protein NYF05_07220 [Clostridioides difficile]